VRPRRGAPGAGRFGFDRRRYAPDQKAKCDDERSAPALAPPILLRLARDRRMLSPKELEAVDNFRFAHRMPSRAAAVRELLRYGISNVGAVLENAGIASGDYGVLKAPKGLGPERKSKS
jgi:hypothetical protein